MTRDRKVDCILFLDRLVGTHSISACHGTTHTQLATSLLHVMRIVRLDFYPKIYPERLDQHTKC